MRSNNGFLSSPYTTGKDINIVEYLGIASDEPKRTPRIEENIVHTIEMFKRDGFNIRIWTQNGTFYANNMPNVFKTKDQAEKRLKELKND